MILSQGTMNPQLRFKARSKNLIGIDEAGRGPIAGPVTVAAVIIFPHFDLRKLLEIKDSKQLNPQKREVWFKKAHLFKKEGFIDFAISFSSQKVIDSRGIVSAVQSSLNHSIKKICKEPLLAHVFLDGGLRAPVEFKHQNTIIRGDEKISIIALASILAKVERDKKMISYGQKFPHYDFEQHKGYGTYPHYRAIKKHGITPLHRKSFLKNLTNKKRKNIIIGE